ncbi:SDR family NAD(P)-dependent oxidoreductase [Maritimibacter sp. HL-12]|jgi:7-alpha-hydroxysteroid dehydrogenase|uniref:SDR family NAD(P)-dependent oxidoreductase n=1 Tax=Maritimibacter sp. HL-12 TaxID=1162418 RepID=UPI000A0F01F2|nr:SDR family oxidoreductase [Maritimibacter sp. HL-12]SMH48225.1 7-alpha-hydroxysteroid dehydrogenase [Maritimibacter sp. HL-12]
MSFSISGKTAIVTGAANGVGLAIARHFSEQGANVVCADIDEARLIDEFGHNPENGVEQEAAEANNIRIFAGDLRKKLTIKNLISTTVDSFERVDILVNASRQVCTSDPLDMSDSTVENLIEQNLMTALRLSQAVAKRMMRQGEAQPEDSDEPLGAIVNLSSIAATRTQPGLMAFSISAAALEQMTRAFAVALAPHRIRVNAISFGSVMSASLRDALREHDDMRGMIIDGTPLGRIAGANEVAETARFLASEGAGFMTGQILTVDGGRTLVDAVGAPAH